MLLEVLTDFSLDPFMRVLIRFLHYFHGKTKKLRQPMSKRISRSKRKSAKRKRLVERLLPMMEPVNVIAAGPDNKPTTPPENTLDTPLQPQSITPKTWRPSFRFVIEWPDFPIVKSLLALAGILGFLIAIFVLRPLPNTISSPLMTHEKEDPLYADFQISNQGHIGMRDVRVTCWPAKTIYENGDTLSDGNSSNLLPAYANPSIDSLSSFTVRYSPLFDLTLVNNSEPGR